MTYRVNSAWHVGVMWMTTMPGVRSGTRAGAGKISCPTSRRCREFLRAQVKADRDCELTSGSNNRPKTSLRQLLPWPPLATFRGIIQSVVTLARCSIHIPTTSGREVVSKPEPERDVRMLIFSQPIGGMLPMRLGSLRSTTLSVEASRVSCECQCVTSNRGADHVDIRQASSGSLQPWTPGP